MLPHEATCIFEMKYRGKDDNMPAYRAHLASPIVRTDQKTGTSHPSEVVTVGMETIGGREWLTGRHLGSQMANYYTDYYAALTSHVAILFTCSAHHEYVAKYARDFRTMVSSLTIYQRDAGR